MNSTLDKASDLLAGASWTCAYAEPDSRCDPEDPRPTSRWYPVQMPGTAAQALSAAGGDLALLRDYDRYEWWFRCTFPGSEDRHRLHLGGLATIADVWLNGDHLLHSENMFVAHDVEVDELLESNELLIRFSPLHDLLSVRRPRPRWRSARVHDQNMRWIRTTLLGRLPGWAHSPPPVGPWRGLTLSPTQPVEVRRDRLVATPAEGGRGVVAVEAVVRGAEPGATVTVLVGDAAHESTLSQEADHQRLRAEVTLDNVSLWWPHTHGDQPLYDVAVELGDARHALGQVGFRTLEVDRTDGAFTFVVNGVPLFARGTNWAPCDLVGYHTGDERLRHNVELLRDGQHNMVRVPGNGVYEDASFYDLLDELGILLWQDCMFAFLDTPDDPDLEASIRQELAQLFTELQGRPCLALVCGGADTEEQAAYHGVARDQWASPVAARVIPEVLDDLLPGTAYLRATPGDSPLPTATNTGVCHYLSVPAYQRELEDFRTADVRFAAESMPVPTPPEPLPLALQATVRRGLELTPDPRQAVHRDSEVVPWDMADTMVPYVERIFGVHELALKQQEPERLPLVQTATSVRLFEVGLAEWRRPDSRCAGALTLYGRDPRWGPGLGMIDSLDRPKATWFAMRRVMAPIAILLTDEGFSGLGVHLVNDRAEAVAGTVRLDLYFDGEVLLESDEVALSVPARGGTSIDTTTLFSGFRDLSWAYRFGPPAADVVAVTFTAQDGSVLSEGVHLPGGPARPRVADLGLAVVLHDHVDEPRVTVSTRLFAQWVRLDVPGWRPEDSWFHLPPGQSRTLSLTRDPGTTGSPRGRVAAFNSDRTARISPSESA